jgi:TonB family protein
MMGSGNHMRLAILLVIAVVSLRSQEISHNTQPRLIHKVDPQYTKEALDAKLQGTVALDAVIGIDGIPSDIKVVRALGMGLEEKAIECLRQWRFSPGSSHGEPIPVKVRVEINFRIPDSPAEKPISK